MPHDVSRVDSEDSFSKQPSDIHIPFGKNRSSKISETHPLFENASKSVSLMLMCVAEESESHGNQV